MRSASFLYRRYSVVVLVAGLVVLMLAIYGAGRNQINDRFTQFISEKYEYRTDTDYINQHAGGVNSLEFVVVSGPNSVLANPFIASLSSAVEEIRDLSGVVSVLSITNVIERMNKLINTKEEILQIALSELQDNTLSEYFLVYEMSLPEGVDVDNLVDISKESTRLLVGTDMVDSRNLLELEQRIDSVLVEKMGDNVDFMSASTSTVISRIGFLAVVGGVFGAIAALLIISGMIGLLFRSWKIYLMATVINTIPVVMGFGIWGLTHAELGLNLSVSLGVAVGVIVDDTVHILHHYQRGLKDGMDRVAAIDWSMQQVTNAITMSTLVIITGFMPMLFSDYQVIHDNALMMIYIVAFAFIYDLLVLPAAIVFFSKKRESSDATKATSTPITGTFQP